MTPLDPAKFVQALERKVSLAQDSAVSGEVVELALDLNTAYPPASTAGEPPHRRTGALQQGVKQETEITEGFVISRIESTRVEGNAMVPEWLEFGTSKMAARPYVRPSYERFRDGGLARIAAEARG